MSTPIIEIKNIGKRYILRHEKGRYKTLRDSLIEIITRPFALLKNIFNKKEHFWALKNIDLTVHKGEVIGVIGKNGAGKSTLLKVLSQITPPTEGTATITGSVGSLLEVGTGFHPELSGRENIFLNGAILGMKKKEVVKKFDDIVSFAGIEKFLDTPVKYYSSGMYVRLAFSVAAHMEPDILIIDEVLAVGDAAFQKKCLGKMKEITQKEGRTILFVSHNMLAIKELCTRCVYLSKGKVEMIGETNAVVQKYLSGSIQEDKTESVQLHGSHTGLMRLTHISASNTAKKSPIKSHDRLCVEMNYDSDFKDHIEDVRIVLTIRSKYSNQTVLRLDSEVSQGMLTLNPSGKLVCETGVLELIDGTYTIDADLLIQGTSVDFRKDALSFEVETDITHYRYEKQPDVTVCDRVISYTFTHNETN